MTDLTKEQIKVIDEINEVLRASFINKVKDYSNLDVVTLMASIGMYIFQQLGSSLKDDGTSLCRCS